MGELELHFWQMTTLDQAKPEPRKIFEREFYLGYVESIDHAGSLVRMGELSEKKSLVDGRNDKVMRSSQNMKRVIVTARDWIYSLARSSDIVGLVRHSE
jgi:hypothetical protein